MGLWLTTCGEAEDVGAPVVRGVAQVFHVLLAPAAARR